VSGFVAELDAMTAVSRLESRLRQLAPQSDDAENVSGHVRWGTNCDGLRTRRLR